MFHCDIIFFRAHSFLQLLQSLFQRVCYSSPGLLQLLWPSEQECPSLALTLPRLVVRSSSSLCSCNWAHLTEEKTNQVCNMETAKKLWITSDKDVKVEIFCSFHFQFSRCSFVHKAIVHVRHFLLQKLHNQLVQIFFSSYAHTLRVTKIFVGLKQLFSVPYMFNEDLCSEED